MALEPLPAFADWCFTQSLLYSGFAQARKVNKRRGAWRRPQLTGAVARLNRALLAEFDFTEHVIALLVAGEAPPEREQAEPVPDVSAALTHHGFDPGIADRDVDPGSAAAVLLILAAFRAKQLQFANAAVETITRDARVALLKRLGHGDAPELPETAGLPSQVARVYEDDARRFYQDLLDGTARAPIGVQQITGLVTVGSAVTALRFLFDAEAFRLTLFAEALGWDAWMAGFRAAAVEATSAARLAGQAPPQFVWTGPADAKTCAPCLSMFRGPVVASSLAELPAPAAICSGQRNCRHWWSPA